MALLAALRKYQLFLVSGFSIVALLFVWDFVAAYVVADPVFLPRPVLVAETIRRYLTTPYPSQGETLIGHALISCGRIAIGFGAGTFVGIVLGAVMAASGVVRSLVNPFIQITRPLPTLAFIPILVIWFGIGELPKVALIMMGVVPIITVSTAAALEQVPASMIDAARSLGASETYALLHVRIRYAIPHIITGMRLSMGVAWTSIVVAELITGTNGLGFVIQQAGLFLNTKLIFAGIAVIGALGLTIDGVFRLIQLYLDPEARLK